MYGDMMYWQEGEPRPGLPLEAQEPSEFVELFKAAHDLPEYTAFLHDLPGSRIDYSARDLCELFAGYLDLQAGLVATDDWVVTALSRHGL